MVGEGCIKARRYRGVVAWLAVVVLVAACGTAAEDGLDPSGGLRQHLLDRIAQAEGMAAEILADGWVTDAELERALLAAVACMVDRGLDAKAYIDWVSPVVVSWEYPVSDPQDTAAEEAIAGACFAEHFDLVRDVYDFQQSMTESERVDLFTRIAQCLRDRGFRVDADTPEAVFDATSDLEGSIAYGECYEAVVGG